MNKKTLSEIVWEAIQQALADNNDDRAAAARQLGIGRTTMYRHLAKHDKSKKAGK